MVPIGDEMAMDDLRQLAFQAAERLARRLVLGELALVMVAPGARMHGLDRAARCSALLSERLPLRDRRCRAPMGSEAAGRAASLG